MNSFWQQHKVFLTILVVALFAYYLIFFLVYGFPWKIKRKPKKDEKIKNIVISNSILNNIDILASEIDDNIPVIEGEKFSSDVNEENDWKQHLEDINKQSIDLTKKNKIDDLLTENDIDFYPEEEE